MRFDKVPIGSMVMSMLSPACKNFGGVNPLPTPDGVPVAIISPASSVMPFDSVSINSAIEKIISLVEPDWAQFAVDSRFNL